MEARELARRHYDRYCGDGRPSISVPEWSDEGGDALIVYWRPFTLRDHGSIFGNEPADAKSYAKVVARKAENREGKKLFPDQEDLHVLLAHADHAVVRRIAEAIMQSPSMQELVERLEQDGFRLAMHRVADRLGKTIEEIEAMPMALFNETLAYHKVEARRRAS